MIPPCKDCQKRHAGCHDDCPAYKEFSIAIKEENHRISIEKQKRRLWVRLKSDRRLT